MGHKHNQHRKKRKMGRTGGSRQQNASGEISAEPQDFLELVLKCDCEGSRDAIVRAVKSINIPGFSVRIIFSGVGEINKSDLFMAGTTVSRLIIGYEVEVGRIIEEEAKSIGIEVRLYKVIYRLLDDLENIGASLMGGDEEERVLGRAKVVALFKSCRKGVILGCEVLEGRIARGDGFRVIGAMGEIYSGRVGSLHMERDAVDSAAKGRKVGLKIEHFNKAVVGDYVECVKLPAPKLPRWSATPGITRVQ